MGIVISGTTGSGKTLAYLVPLLSTLSDSLFVRQRIRVGAEENVGDTTDNLLERVALVTSPVVRTNSQRPIRQGAIATGAAISTLGKSGKDVKSPLALLVVPTRELGIQTAMLLYQLVGGNVKKSATEMVGKANMFKVVS
jgi:superfamily II DNA/RNA helicase